MNSEFKWIQWDANEGIPPAAVYAGYHVDGSPIFVGRAYHEDGLLPAKVIPSQQIGYFSFDGTEISTNELEILTGPTGYNWVSSENGEVPENAVEGGRTSEGETLYVGRTHHAGSLTPGRIQRSEGRLFIAYEDAEHGYATYEVLVAHTESPKPDGDEECCSETSNEDPKWIPCTTLNEIPHDAVYAGIDIDDSTIYVGRAYFKDDLLPGKVVPARQIAYVTHGGKEVYTRNFEYLTGTGFSWECAENGNVPENAFSAGRTTTGETLYVGRTEHDGRLTPGKVHPSHECMYVGFGLVEYKYYSYEVLVYDGGC